MVHRILFVCLGNICRSPSAEAVVRAKAAERGLSLTLDSAGTGDWHIGSPPYGPMQTSAHRRGYDLSTLRARQVKASDFGDFDMIVAMDDDNISTLTAIRPDGAGGALVRFTDFVEGDERSIPDPYFTRDFNGTLDLIERCADGLLDRLQE